MITVVTIEETAIDIVEIMAAFESEDAVSIHETMGTGLEFPPMEREGPPK